VEIDYWRQADLVLPDELPRVTVIGVGGIGSFVVLALAKMGCQHITAYDPDTVESHNIPNQLYKIADIGKLKCSAAKQLVAEFTNVDLLYDNLLMDKSIIGVLQLNGVVISGVDSMAARKDIWNQIKYKPAISLYIDARAGADVSRIYSLNPCDPDHIEWYESSALYDDSEALEVPCTARAIIYNGFAVAALIASQVKKFAKHEKVVKEIIMDFKTLILMTTD
jgi:hypothetical protein